MSEANGNSLDSLVGLSGFRCIVADPPWRYKGTLPGFLKDRLARSRVPYDTMTMGEIAALPVMSCASDDAHLYLWTTNTHLFESKCVAEAWGFKYSTLLVWCKNPRGFAGFPTWNVCTEYVLFCRRGSLKATKRIDRNWWIWQRTPHSAKPEAFQDMVEAVSPGPRLELFARRARPGWTVWGNEVEANNAIEERAAALDL